MGSGDFLAMQSSTRCVRCDLEAVSTQLHAAPAAGPLLAGVLEMQDAARALSNSRSVSGGQKTHHVIQERSKYIFCTPQIEVPRPLQTRLGPTNLIYKGVLQQQAIQPVDEGRRRQATRLELKHDLPPRLAKLP